SVATIKGKMLIEVLKVTPAEKASLKASDVITKAGDRTVEDSEDLVRALRDADKKVTLTIVRKNATRTIESELRESTVIRMRHDGSMSWQDGNIRIRRDVSDDVRRQLDELRRELRDLKTKVEEKSRN